ncbi:MAG TPA: hypothetical protein VG455_01835 [Acidimicrobiales bacterium]|nr:hypothetical protein [Acidimicrobiales bacterium]
MARFLSPEWLDGMAAAAAASEALLEAATGPELRIRQLVRGGPDGDVAYTVRIGGGRVSVEPDGHAADLDVVSDYATAAAISQGRLSPAAAFATGRRKLAGRVGMLAGLRGPNAEAGLRGPNAEAGLRGPNADTGHAALLFELGDVFGPLRATTEY